MSSTGELVHVICGANEQWIGLSGRSVAEVKRNLRDVFNIPYFAHAYLNGSVVDLSVKVAGGDTLEFVQAVGLKGGGEERESPEETLAEVLHQCSPELQAIGTQVKEMGLSMEESIDRTIKLVSQHFVRYFGPVGAGEQPVLSALARMMVMQEARLKRLEAQILGQVPPQVDGTQQTPRLATDRPLIDRQAFTMAWNGKTYTFKNTKEFSILAYLARNFDRWVPYRHLLSEIWQDTQVEANTVHKTISNLRTRLRGLGNTDLEIDGSNPNHYRLRRS
jgi:hypothetical protein